MTAEIRVYFHPHSPYSRLGLHRLDRANLPDSISVKPFILSHSAGEGVPPNPIRTPARMAYLTEDAPRETIGCGLPIAMPSPLKPSYTPFYKAYFAARDAGKEMAFALAASHARWGRGEDISNPEILLACADEAGLSFDLSELNDPSDALSDALSGDQEMVEKDGAIGVPFAVLDTGKRAEKFFGQDRFELMIERALSS